LASALRKHRDLRSTRVLCQHDRELAGHARWASHGGDEGLTERSWGRVFAVASVLTPLVFGMAIGALTEGRLRLVDGRVTGGLFKPWLTPFAILVGFFALTLFAYLAAVYLTLEADTPELARDFRRRAFIGGASVAVLALAGFLALRGAPEVRAGLTRSAFVVPDDTMRPLRPRRFACCWRHLPLARSL